MNDNFDIKKVFKENVLKTKLLTWNEILTLLQDYEIETQYLNSLKSWYHKICNLDFIDFEQDFEEIIIHDQKNVCYISKGSKKSEIIDLTQSDLELSLMVLCLKNHIEWNFKNPFVSFHASVYNKSYRISLIHKSTGPNNISKAFIRSISKEIFPLFNYLNYGHNLIEAMIKDKKNILICGPTGSGKTSLLNNFISQVDSQEHIVVIEDTQEIKVNHKYTTSFLTSNFENKSMNDYLTYSMRISPDRIILGELRSKEVISFLLALNTGHNGAMSTVHANNAADAIHRIALLYCIYSESNLSYELILKLVSQNIDYVFYMENKKVVDICRIFGSDKDQIMYESIIDFNETIQLGAS